MFIIPQTRPLINLKSNLMKSFLCFLQEKSLSFLFFNTFTENFQIGILL
ncbi:hypothetical protein HMPREF1235_1662 [Streptococcus pyogenes GA41208]|nr:hypothetical protein HMPREF1235_1662 [Streptococcus pyogenes GA41208]